MSILQKLVLDLRAATRGRWAAIAEATEVPEDTIRKIAYGDTTDPKLSTVEPLIEYFDSIKRKRIKLPPLPPTARKSRHPALTN